MSMRHVHVHVPCLHSWSMSMVMIHIAMSACSVMCCAPTPGPLLPSGHAPACLAGRDGGSLPRGRPPPSALGACLTPPSAQGELSPACASDGCPRHYAVCAPPRVRRFCGAFSRSAPHRQSAGPREVEAGEGVTGSRGPSHGCAVPARMYNCVCVRRIQIGNLEPTNSACAIGTERGSRRPRADPTGVSSTIGTVRTRHATRVRR